MTNEGNKCLPPSVITLPPPRRGKNLTAWNILPPWPRPIVRPCLCTLQSLNWNNNRPQPTWYWHQRSMEESFSFGKRHLVTWIQLNFSFRKLPLRERWFNIFMCLSCYSVRRFSKFRIYLPVSAFTGLFLRSLGDLHEELVQRQVVSDRVLKNKKLWRIEF